MVVASTNDGIDDVEVDPWIGDPRLETFFGPAWPAVEGFHRMLVTEGELRGLIGPREVPRLWERHLLNSAAVVPFLPQRGVIVDVGSGAGLPGIVAAAMLPEAAVVLLEPMERRVVWLGDVVSATGLANVEIRRGRAQEMDEGVADAVTVRAVASLDKLYRWTAPILRAGGTLVALKGERADDEVLAATRAAKETGMIGAQVRASETIQGVAAARVVTAERGRPGRVR
ncbi:16S rRNA (guanine(527)-N(7))-methyltransferase RsmG [Cellulomonas oligotrophica]|uniref:Ribosomal RNA small subunit methyltransferase G n=1 Tax=Cellulomonas oligotrophica TaxID=931536 RepID=A0A7Y9JZV5_9CELL|nr:16S rRNA (guanine(527)-N(7))-methyltransferase RsmG [Cellulomonas oligotrophica]NYD86645.1 16S rRNA (guanine527-N7)-methyltransferase [Cellulomonas oligotrophica]GIG34376.1 ribosomal RNA small subunit methyltransferase G [Cellulomonas oligotrophica]